MVVVDAAVWLDVFAELFPEDFDYFADVFYFLRTVGYIDEAIVIHKR